MFSFKVKTERVMMSSTVGIFVIAVIAAFHTSLCPAGSVGILSDMQSHGKTYSQLDPLKNDMAGPLVLVSLIFDVFRRKIIRQDNIIRHLQEQLNKQSP